MKLLTAFLFAVLSCAAWAQGAPAPGPHPHPRPPRPIPQDDACEATYYGYYQMAGGPLWISFDRLNGRGDINVTLNFRGNIFYGQGRCNDEGVNFWVRGGWPHEGRFYWGDGEIQLQGTQWVEGRPYQNFFVNTRGY
jgi:hypothetical protein